MPHSTNKPGFSSAAETSKLVTREQINAAMAAVAKETGAKTAAEISDKKLAAQMVRMEFLTPYQADQLLTGRTKLTLGPYVITAWIGQGGMGQVFKGIHNVLGRESAIKVLPLHKSTEESIRNFEREIRAQAKLDHPNLVRAFDAGRDGRVHYLVVEYVPGTDLRRLVRTKGKLSVQQAANIIKQSAEGLAHAHQKNLIHRDIKPGNILVTQDGVAKLSDLGLAFHLNDPNDPRIGKIVGTADYLSPEQIRTPMDVTEVSDIYSLGCTLYYAITGKVPFPGGTPKSKARRHLQETPWHPRRFNEEVSDDFVDLIGDMMEKETSERIQSASEVAERLAPWASDNSPLMSDEIGKQRWQPAPIASIDNQDTDPNLDIAELAMNEMSDTSHSGHLQGTIGMGDPGVDTGSFSSSSSVVLPGAISAEKHPKTVSEKFSAAGHLPQEVPMVSSRVMFVVSVTTAIIGAAIGLLAGFVLFGGG
ncbi:MAG: serine/threonine-protein kinase [Planctomycetota bacterium]